MVPKRKNVSLIVDSNCNLPILYKIQDTDQSSIIVFDSGKKVSIYSNEIGSSLVDSLQVEESRIVNLFD